MGDSKLQLFIKKLSLFGSLLYLIFKKLIISRLKGGYERHKSKRSLLKQSLLI